MIGRSPLVPEAALHALLLLGIVVTSGVIGMLVGHQVERVYFMRFRRWPRAWLVLASSVGAALLSVVLLDQLLL